ncbi:MAG: hypothetical protein ACLQKA_24280 [Bryobacteraceae bacterium]
MNARVLILVPLFCTALLGEDPDPAPVKPTGEIRYSLSLTEEGSFAAGLRVPGADTGNLLLLEPSFAYKYEDRWRFSTSLAGLAEKQGDTHEQVRVRETYVGFTEGDLDLTIGKRILRWGAGYAFTATGVLDPPRVATDPTDRLNLNEGRELGEADWIAGKQDFTIVWASAGLVGQHQPGVRDTAAFRYGVMFDGFDTAVIVAHDGGGSTLAGANFTRVIGDAVEIHGELAWRQQAAVLLGGKYTLRSGFSAIAEFYTPPNTAYYRPIGMPASVGRQHYGFLRLGKSPLRELPGWKEWDVTVSFVSNLDDGSRIGVFDAGRRVKNHFRAYLHAQTPGGKPGRSEFGAIPYSALVSIGVTVQM